MINLEKQYNFMFIFDDSTYFYFFLNDVTYNMGKKEHLIFVYYLNEVYPKSHWILVFLSYQEKPWLDQPNEIGNFRLIG